jgi:Fe-S oxidoreductase
MIREVATEPVIWGCTTCGWCEEGCPVAIEHIQRIVDMRRHAVLVRSEFPSDLAGSFRGTENQSQRMPRDSPMTRPERFPTSMRCRFVCKGAWREG